MRLTVFGEFARANGWLMRAQRLVDRNEVDCGYLRDFVGQHFEYSMSSTMIHGVGRDAARNVSAIEKSHTHLSAH